METLTFTYRNKQISAKMEIIQKHMSFTEYHLHGKDGHQLFIFRRESSKWRFVYGSLFDELRECILDALILRFHDDVVKTFMYKGERQIVTVSEVKGNSGTWNVMINRYYIGFVSRNFESGAYSWHIHNEGGWIRPRHMELFMEMIKDGRIRNEATKQNY
ncbi:hypothetical protein M8998_07185 [Sphingobacterium sp. lm-10]|uniref:hypothetical protein n=1 Tax=Sphingobacterium sp. lm-10 TaxID=2944904 RepID=UPI00202113AD|nr:hypothetical protein [Sphingobacterium sp. lm-10]MCL7987717.1 hypothetical protein [Sphingobacterium sp. lm-10]